MEGGGWRFTSVSQEPELLKSTLIFPLEEIPKLLKVFTAGDYVKMD